MARATLDNLRTRLRKLINDSASPYTWTDEELDGYLDQNRTRANQVALAAEPTRTPTTITYTHFSAPYGNWEEDATLVDSGYNSVTADTINYATGVWEFNSSQSNRPIMVTGWYYDLNATAADVLEEQLASLIGAYDFSADGGSYKRSQQVENLEKAIKKYRSLQMSQTVELYRSDVNLYQY